MTSNLDDVVFEHDRFCVPGDCSPMCRLFVVEARDRLKRAGGRKQPRVVMAEYGAAEGQAGL